MADFAVPGALACAQLFGTWLLTTGVDRPLGHGQWTAVAVSVIGSCLALIWRRVAPVPVLAAAVLLNGAGLLAVQSTETLVAGLSDGVALYSVAVQRGRRVAMAGCLATFTVAFAVALPVEQTASDLALNEALNVLYYIVVTALGQLRREHRERRDRLAERLAGADRERSAAAGSERERLARDLHDVAGHHLSAVVVHSGAVARRSDPELTAAALSAAAETGRDVLKALSRLVDVMGTESEDGELDAMLPALCQGLIRVGVPVSLVVEGAPSASRGPLLATLRRARALRGAAEEPRGSGLRPEVSTAAYRIVQESLTNALRYAPGASVAVEVRHLPDAVEVAVVNEAPSEGGSVPALGTGRGIAGMRGRAKALGGTLAAGPDESGGWSVRAVLPTSPTSPAALAGTRRGPGWPEVLDAAVVVFCAILPPLLAFLPPDPVLGGWSAGGSVLVVIALVARAVPLWWRRRAPYLTLGALILIDVGWALTAGARSVDLLGVLVLGCTAEMIAVYSVAGHARPGRPTWPAPFAATLPWAVAWTVLLVTAPDARPGPWTIPFGLAGGVLFGALVLLPFWAWGRTVTGRGQRWETTARETVATRTGEAVQAERHRVALGLSGTVLEHTARLVRIAEAGAAGTPQDAREALDGVVEQARAALIDMRALLDALDEE
ncbi:ATP-binding protein [Spirillospora sp. NBC_01491]|uniref:ATP-binding protein n=1 Tax=Spirillospora sp. NBC_01491 TaxID=2976007 RepID=UPI002E3202D7|nr:histidine kinase [Spirillospora sp. NBC_01491]